MLRNLKLLLLVAFALLIFGLAPQFAKAADCNSSTAAAIQCGTNNAAGVPADANPTQIDTTISNVVNIISVAIGVVAVIMVMVGGLRYVTSGGNQDSVKKAKSTLIYALTGLVIVALAQVIVKFVLHKTT